MEDTMASHIGSGILDPQISIQTSSGRSPQDQTPSQGECDETLPRRTRGRTGCLNCRRRRKKCDEKKPACSKCNSRGEKCAWDVGVSFRYCGLDAGHPSMRESGGGKRYQRALSEFQVGHPSHRTKLQMYCVRPLQNFTDQYYNQTVVLTTDVSNSDAKGSASHDSPGNSGVSQSLSSRTISDESQPWSGNAIRNSLEALNSGQCQRVPNPIMESGALQAETASDHGSGPNGFSDGNSVISRNYVQHSPSQSLYPSIINPLGRSLPKISSDGVYTDYEALIARRTPSLSERAEALSSPGAEVIDQPLDARRISGESTTFSTHNGSNQAEIVTSELDALDYLMSNPSSAILFASAASQDENLSWPSNQAHDFMPLDQIMADSPDMYASYYPNPTYEELHTVLHHHMVETARFTALTRQATPEATAQNSLTTKRDQAPSRYTDSVTFEPSHSLIRPLGGKKLTNRRELELWQNYLDEVAIWLDMFDIERHFQLKIPMMAKSADHLHYSILALSARQMERKDPDKPYTESLALYQEAIELIVQKLHSLDTAVIASCVLLCVLEMMSSSPRAWGRHLEGCAMLLQAAEINGTVSGVRQALFWCFARMDVWGGFLSGAKTKIPTSRWFFPTGSMSMAVSRFKTGSGGSDSYANYAVFLCASVVNFLSNRHEAFSGQGEHQSDDKTSYSARWKALFDLLEDWYDSRGEEMRPLMSCPAALDEHQHPFPIVLYGTSPAVNGNQLYHASALLMLQEKPKDIRLGKNHKVVLWHARQICGIANSNRNHGPWINALQPLWIAGKVMSHPIEHRVILDILGCIEKETGWATSWRAEDLKEYWGESDL